MMYETMSVLQTRERNGKKARLLLEFGTKLFAMGLTK